MRVFYLECENGDSLCVLADGDKAQIVASAEADNHAPVQEAVLGLTLFFGVPVEEWDVPPTITAADDWNFDDCLEWLQAVVEMEAFLTEPKPVTRG